MPNRSSTFREKTSVPSCTLGLAGWQTVDLHLGVLDGGFRNGD